MLAGGSVLLDSIDDPIYGKNARDIFTPIIQLVVALAVIFGIIADLTKSHHHMNANMGQDNKN